MQSTTLHDLYTQILNRHQASPGRLIVAIAGPPGSGKSTVAEDLLHLLNAGPAPVAAILPMDGYHYDDGLLTSMGRLAFKGAPDTFDVGGFTNTLKRLRLRDEPQVAVPVFDRSLEISRGSARMITQGLPIIITEGNYLLLDQAPWTGLRSLFDVTVKIETPLETLRMRLQQRWRGFGLAEAEVQRKVETNDLPNAQFVMANTSTADFVLPT